MGAPLAQQLEWILRIAVAAVCGGLIGIERSRRFKDAGVRTHCIVACAAAMLMIVSKYGFYDLSRDAGAFFPGDRGADPARIAAQIVSGVSFLGVGIIYRDRKLATRGLTTAAGIWAVAGVGMAIGSGLYLIGLFTTAFLLLLQFLTHRFAFGKDKYVGMNLEIIMDDDMDALRAIQARMAQDRVVVMESHFTRDSGLLHCAMLVRMESRKHLQDVLDYAADDVKVHSVIMNDED